MPAFKHILVPTDFSRASEAAEDAAVALARAFGARLSLLHVWSLPNMDYTDALSWPLPRFVLGSVAEKIVRLSPVPVMTYRDPEPAR